MNEKQIRYKLIHQHTRPSVYDVIPLYKLIHSDDVDAYALFRLHENINEQWQDNFIGE